MPAVTPFAPRRGKVVPAVLAVAAVVLFLAVAVLVPEKYQLVDRIAFAGMGLAIAALLLRYVTIRAVPQDDGLFVRNIGAGQLVPWEEIEAVRFSDGMPWVRLDLADGDEQAVMAIQRADGPRSVQEAQRLSDLVAAHQRP
jgi:hypothetical protein